MKFPYFTKSHIEGDNLEPMALVAITILVEFHRLKDNDRNLLQVNNFTSP